MKNLFSIIFVLFGINDLLSQIITFEDPAFKLALVSSICVDTDQDMILDSDADFNNDGEIGVEEAKLIKYLDISSKNITSIKEIYFFENVETILCNYNNIKKIHLDKDQLRLKTFSLRNNPVDTFIINANTNIRALFLGSVFEIYNRTNDILGKTKVKFYKEDKSNFLSDIEKFDIINIFNFDSINAVNFTISNSKHLREFNIYSAKSDQIYISNLDSLEKVNLVNTKAKMIAIQNLPKITSFDLYYNDIDSLLIMDLPQCKKINAILNGLKYFSMNSMDSIEDLDLNWNELTKLIIKETPRLKILSCTGNKLTELELVESLESVSLSYNKISSLDFSNTKLINWVSCSHNNISYLDITPLKKIKYLYCYNNNIEEIRTNENSELIWVKCDSNRLSDINFSAMPNLQIFNANSNLFSKLKIHNHQSLKYIYLEDNLISDVDLNNLDSISWLSLPKNKLSKIDISNLNSLNVLDIDDNLFSNFIAPELPELWAVDVNNNDFLKELDLSNLNKLIYLECSDNDSLLYINIKNGSIEDNGLFRFDTLILNNNSQLKYVCCDKEQITQVNEISTNSHPNVVVSDSCYNGLPCPSDSIWIENNTINVFLDRGDRGEYKWFDCITDTLITKTSLPQFQPNKTGSYYCIIKGLFCETKTDCIDLISSTSNPPDLIRTVIIPNPNNGNFEIRSNGIFNKIEIINNIGQLISLKETQPTDIYTHDNSLNTGIYLIRLSFVNNETGFFKMIVI